MNLSNTWQRRGAFHIGLIACFVLASACHRDKKKVRAETRETSAEHPEIPLAKPEPPPPSPPERRVLLEETFRIARIYFEALLEENYGDRTYRILAFATIKETVPGEARSLPPESVMNWFKSLEKDQLAQVVARLILHYASDNQFLAAYGGPWRDQETLTFDLDRKLQFLLAELEKLDPSAVTVKAFPYNEDSTEYFENQEYERNWSNLTKMAYRWEKRVPGFVEELKEELRLHLTQR